MIIRLDGYLDGEFATRLTIQGVGLGNTSTQRLIRSINRIPFNFNVTIKGPFRALIATAKSFRDPTQVIEPRCRARWTRFRASSSRRGAWRRKSNSRRRRSTRRSPNPHATKP